VVLTQGSSKVFANVGRMAKQNLGQSYHDDVEALKATGVSNVDAIRQVAAQYGKTEGAIRGGIYAYTQKSSATSNRKIRAATVTSDDLVADAKKLLQDALALVDREVEQAKQALDVAQAKYDSVASSVKDKKADLEKKIKALTGS
jgi:hypothetical protein